ncbi:MAG: CoA pyrophosphatase [Asgard group archaeon]|nr:CoA pyrophosphatase [Asgard group archaeon]
MSDLNSIKQIMSGYNPNQLIDDGSAKGAVMVPIYEKENQLYMLFTKRTLELSSHKGQISFPGGKMEDQDKTLFDCAVRETFEEIGIENSFVELLGELDQIKTFGSNILLSPFVCKINYPFPLKINKMEVEEVIEVPFSELFNKNNWDVKKVMLAGIKERHIYYFFYENWTIWGATGRIVNQFIELF